MEAVTGESGKADRMQTLRERVLQARPGICLERARCYTRVYQDFSREPVVVRRALALKKTLLDMTIFIEKETLLAGNHSSQLRAAPIFPEYAVEWIEQEIDQFDQRPGDRFFLAPDEETAREKREELLEICRFWRGKTTLDRGRALMAPHLREIHESGIIRAEGNLTSGDAHIAVNNQQILDIGLGGYLERVTSRRRDCDLTSREGLASDQFFRALEISLEALQEFIGRYADLAAQLLRDPTTGARRREELQRIGETCRFIATNPPRTFYEALQLTWFVQLALQIESNGHSLSLGRMDQYLYPFYRADLEAGRIGEDEARELLENLWIKLLSVNKIRSWSHTRYSAGSPLYQNVTIGGQTPEGTDAVNELSYLILRSVAATRLTQPNLSVRFHRAMSEDFLQECLRVVSLGFGMPAFNNDEVVIPSFMALGVSEEDARNYSAIGCIEVAVPGKWGYRCTGKHFINFARVFLAALRDGMDTMSGKRFFPGRGRLEDFTSFDQVMEAWKDQISHYARAGIAIDTAIDTVLEEDAPDLLCSAFVDDCIGRGKTIHQGGSVYDFVSGLQVGIANLGNSLAAIRKLVFEEQTISAEDLMQHLSSNFAGVQGEAVRRHLLMGAPKFGNDEDEVDLLLARAYGMYLEELEQYRTIRAGRGPIGCRYYGGTSSISANVPSGAVVPATPDGRQAFTPLAEGASPSAGTDLKGPTAVFQSIAKLPTEKILGGVLLNQKVPPQIFDNPAARLKLEHLLRTFFGELKGWHVQYNVVDRATLLAAQENPEAHRDLIVRVAGYSAFFTTLSQEAQDDIIARTEQAL